MLNIDLYTYIICQGKCKQNIRASQGKWTYGLGNVVVDVISLYNKLFNIIHCFTFLYAQKKIFVRANKFKKNRNNQG